MLRAADHDVIQELGHPFELKQDGVFLAIVIDNYPMTRGLHPASSTLMLRMPPGFPDAAPDMFWLDPPVSFNGVPIPGTEARETYLGRTWQRWSRHIQGQWRPGIDNLGTYLAYVRRCLNQAAGRAT